MTLAEVVSEACQNCDPLVATDDLFFICKIVLVWRYDLATNHDN